jgi:hypothetical protein
MRITMRALLSCAGLALLTVGPAPAQTPTFTKYVALGDSYGAGFSADCLVQRNQQFSYPAILAQQLGIAGFQQPTVSDPGIPTCNGLKTLVPSVSFGPISTKTGSPTNLALSRAYDNLSVPGFKIADVSDTVSDATGRTLANLVLRGQGTALNQALSLNPTFITLGLIGNDILPAEGAALFLDGVTVTPLAAYTAKYNAVAAALKASGRTGVFVGTPDVVRLIPLLTTIKPVVTDATGTPVIVGGSTVPLLGPGNAANPCPAGQSACPLPAGTFVTLGANAPQDALGGKSLLALGFGIPCAVAALPQCGKPLPVGSFTPPGTVNVGVVVYPDVIAQIDKRVQDYNTVIKAAADANGFKYLDAYALSKDLIANGRTYGGIHISNAFVTGGMFAYGNAVHMSNIGYSILADELIQFINSAYGTDVPRPDMSVALFTPDVPAPGSTGIGATVDTALFFDEEAWKGFFREFPLQDASLKLAFPGETEVPDRAPVVLPGWRGARD